MLLDTLWYLAVIVLSLLAVVLIALVIFIELARPQILKFQLELPWLVWLTLDQITEMGFSRFWARLLLPALHERGNLEVRVNKNIELDDSDLYVVTRYGFTPHSVHLHEFKLTKRGGRKKGGTSSIKDLMSAWRPARA